MENFIWAIWSISTITALWVGIFIGRLQMKYKIESRDIKERLVTPKDIHGSPMKNSHVDHIDRLHAEILANYQPTSIHRIDSGPSSGTYGVWYS